MTFLIFATFFMQHLLLTLSIDLALIMKYIYQKRIIVVYILVEYFLIMKALFFINKMSASIVL